MSVNLQVLKTTNKNKVNYLLEKRQHYGNIIPMDEKLLKPYDPQATEHIIYKRWEESGF
jgi:hypothetical protein